MLISVTSRRWNSNSEKGLMEPVEYPMREARLRYALVYRPGLFRHLGRANISMPLRCSRRAFVFR